MLEVISVRWLKFVNVVMKDEVVLRVTFDDSPLYENVQSETARDLKKDLERYFKGETVDFSKYDVDLSDLSVFSRMVLEEVRSIPYGKTLTYGELAKRLDTSPRAIGMALKSNPTPLIVPCHRVVAKDGLGGFSSGLEIKRALLKLEGVL